MGAVTKYCPIALSIQEATKVRLKNEQKKKIAAKCRGGGGGGGGKTEKEKKRTKHVDNPKCWPTDDSGRAWENP